MNRSERVRLLRAFRGYGPGELAVRAGLTRQAIGNIETGRSAGSEESLLELAAALDVPRGVLDDDGELLAWLADQTGQQRPPATQRDADPVQNEALELLRELGPDRAKAALALLRSLLTLQGEPPTSGKG